LRAYGSNPGTPSFDTPPEVRIVTAHFDSGLPSGVNGASSCTLHW
jgi:hypothetical protein